MEKLVSNYWPGSGSAASGSTPFGFYDNEAQFQSDAPRVASWCATRLGYPVMDVEMVDTQFYACFEEAITEYSAQVNQFNIRNNLMLLQGSSTGSNHTHTNVQGSAVPYIIKLSDAYGAEAGVGGNVDWKRGSIDIISGSQDYDLDSLYADVSESGKSIEIKKIYHEGPPAVSRFFDPFALTGQGYTNLIDEFGFSGYSPTAQFVLMPVYEDILRMQGIEFNDMVRKSAYSFEIINNKLKIFPVPDDNTTLWFRYIVEDERDEAIVSGSESNVVSDYSNITYDNMPYSNINDVGKQWIKRYTLALSKELLGAIRSKYQNLPIPESEYSLDGSELRTQAEQEKESLIVELRENLEELTRETQLQKRADEAEQHQRMLGKIPLPIWVG